MIFIDNHNNYDPRINLAIEEFILQNLSVDKNSYLLFYINEPSIIIGKHQNTIEEINIDYVEEKNIHVVRRLSGGGAVYHDFGNLNFSFITKNDGNSFSNYQKFLQPIIKALKKMGIEAELKGRNDMIIEGKKINGNAQFAKNGKICTHGTLLFNSNLDEVVNSLKVRKDKIESKGIKSIRSRVTNISDYLKEPISIEEFKEKILFSIFETQKKEDIKEIILSKDNWDNIYKISKDRYSSWDWNYGESPDFYIERTQKFPIGIIDIKLNVEEGNISQLKIYGDFFGEGELEEFEKKLIGIAYSKEAIGKALEKVNISYYFGNLTLTEFLTLIY